VKSTIAHLNIVAFDQNKTQLCWLYTHPTAATTAYQPFFVQKTPPVVFVAAHLFVCFFVFLAPFAPLLVGLATKRPHCAEPFYFAETAGEQKNVFGKNDFL
jgi:hypothetical protein